ncbi:MAG: hypothetical protein ACYDCI_00130 [Candidatus Limnocylindrales bacterium]
MNRDEIVETLREWGNENKKLADDVWRRLGFPCRVEPDAAEKCPYDRPPALTKDFVLFSHLWCRCITDDPSEDGDRTRARPCVCASISDWRRSTTAPAEIGELITINFGLGPVEVEIVADDDPRRILPLPDGLFLVADQADDSEARRRTGSATPWWREYADEWPTPVPRGYAGVTEWNDSTTPRAEVGDVLVTNAGLGAVEIEIVADDDPRLRVVTHVEMPSPTDAEPEKDAMERFFFGN